MKDPHPALTNALLNAANEAKLKAKYNAPYYVGMLLEFGGHSTALQLIHKTAPSEGFTHLWERKRLDLTVEAYVLLPQWSQLFQREDLIAAYKRLAEYQYKFPANSWRPDAPSQTVSPHPAPAAPASSDIDDPPPRIKFVAYRILRDTDVAREVKRLHEWKCQICGGSILLPDGTRYAEAHHIRPLGNGHSGLDHPGNVICLCPNHHAECDLGARLLSVQSLRQVDGHKVDAANISYHNQKIARS